MLAESLTENEKNILYQLVAYPDSSDKEISEKISLSVSTVTKIRNKLLHDNYLMRVNIPAIQRLGAELMLIGYGELNPEISIDHKFKIGRKHIRETNSTFFSAGDGNQGFGLRFHKNFTDAMKTTLSLKRFFGNKALIIFEDLKHILISFEIAKIFRFFNYAPLLASTLDIHDPDYRETEYYFPPLPEVHLTRKEKLVLYGFTKYPGINDKQLSKSLGISRQTISTARKRFINEGILSRRYIPDIAKIGFDVIVFYHLQLKHSVNMDPENSWEAMRENNMILSLLHGTDVIGLLAFSTFASCKARITSFLNETRKSNNISGEPTHYLFSPRDVVYQVNHDYTGVLSTLLDMDVKGFGTER